MSDRLQDTRDVQVCGLCSGMDRVAVHHDRKVVEKRAPHSVKVIRDWPWASVVQGLYIYNLLTQ